MKKQGMDWKYYLNELAMSSAQGLKISELERTELAGYLLLRDIEDEKEINQDEFYEDFKRFSGKVAKVLIAESPDTTFDLVQDLKIFVNKFYKQEIDNLLSEKEEEIKEEKSKINPNDEYDPNDIRNNHE